MPPRSTPTFLGYAMKQIVPRTDWPEDPRVKEICSASTCISKEPEHPEKWKRWSFNASGWYSSVQQAQADAAPGAQCTPFAFELFPLLFDNGKATPRPVPDLLGSRPHELPAGHPAGFAFIGYDAISFRPSEPAANGVAPTMPGFDCSPLSCNGCSPKYAVNRSCLIDDWDEACRAATDFSRDEPEPGPYVIVGVYRRLD